MSEIVVTSPFDGREVGRVRRTETSVAVGYVEEAHRLHESRKILPKSERLAILERLASLISSRLEVIAREASLEGGKPLADSRIEIARAVEGIKTAIATLWTSGGREIPMGLSKASEGRRATTRIVPRGPVFAVSAFNHPFNLIVHQVVPAVAVGAPILVKPASKTPLSGERLVALLREAGLSEEFARIVHLDRDTTEALASDPRLGAFSFIGSEAVGNRLRKGLAPGVTCTLEHGGAAPVVVDESADEELALSAITKGAFYHAGQVCVSVQRVFVPNARLASFAERLAERASKLQVGDPLLETTEVGPLITKSELERVATWVEEAKSGGARVVCGGEVLSASLYAPTVLVNPPVEAKVSAKEVFGPVVSLYGYENLDEAIALSNCVPFAFQAAIFSHTPKNVERFIERVNATAVIVNDHSAFRVDWMPFGGLGPSGQGMGGIPDTMRDYTTEKLVVERY